MRSIYLDYNATTPLRDEALETMTRVLRDGYGNPSSTHWAGAEAREVVARAREQVAALMGAAPECVVFTSCATESNNTVLRNAAVRAPRHGNHLVTCATEHPSILEALDELREQGLRVSVLPVESDGREFVDATGAAHELVREVIDGAPHAILDRPGEEGLEQVRITVPEGRYFMMGDNRDNSVDSRRWGTVRRADIVGPVTRIYWSWNNRESWLAMLNPLTWWRLLSGETRWSRMGKSVE